MYTVYKYIKHACIYLKSPFSGNQVFMLFICLCGGFNMLLDKPFDNPFVVSQWHAQKCGLNSPRFAASQTSNQSRQGIDSYR